MDGSSIRIPEPEGSSGKKQIRGLKRFETDTRGCLSCSGGDGCSQKLAAVVKNSTIFSVLGSSGNKKLVQELFRFS